ncbi:MAG: carboxypeptidase-like regulatory domain-containing protein, partial [Terracidiphilus sp.]
MRSFCTLLPRLLAIAAAAAFCSSMLLAQQTLGAITGLVTDSSGGVIPNATVTVVGEQTSLTRTEMTNGTGVYTFVNLPIGTYTLTY